MNFAVLTFAVDFVKSHVVSYTQNASSLKLNLRKFPKVNCESQYCQIHVSRKWTNSHQYSDSVKFILLDKTDNTDGVGVESMIGFFVTADAGCVSLDFGVVAPGFCFCCLAAL
jgi:hypothetical protein